MSSMVADAPADATSDACSDIDGRPCRICYADEFEEGKGAFVRPTPCNCTGGRAAVHAECLRAWQTTAFRKRQWAAGTICHACHSPYTVDLADKGERTPIGIVGGTGLVGRALAARLLTHPTFCLGPLVGSSATAGKPFRAVWEAKEAALVAHYGAALWTAAPFPDALDDVTVASHAEV